MSDGAASDTTGTDGDESSVLSSPRWVKLTARWAVPCLFALCFAAVVVDHVESLRRVRFAEYLAQLIQDHPPVDLSALRTLLGEHVVETGRRAGNVAKREPDVAWFQLKPALWLSLNVDVLPPDDRIGEVRIIGLGSTVLPLDDPVSALPLPDLPFFLFCALTALVGSALGYWRFALAKTRLMDVLILWGVGLLLAPMVLVAAISLSRVSF